MADYARLAVDAGARIVGGCCGTTPRHIAAMRDALVTHVRSAPPGLDTVVARLGEVSSGARAQWQGDLSRAAGAAHGATRPGGRRGRTQVLESGKAALRRSM
jgi:5-methyltetrahydrofolate--homocysteine methyltransferase